jgi:hypothetical protein
MTHPSRALAFREHWQCKGVKVARYLIVGGETAANPEVVQEAETILVRDKDATFTLLVPATHVRQYLGEVKGEDQEVAT